MTKHDFYSFMRFYPIWMVPIGAVLVELGFFYRRRKNILVAKILWGTGGFFVFSTLIWLVMRGDLNSDLWAKWILFDYELGGANGRSPASDIDIPISF